MTDLIPADRKLFFSKKDERDPRLGELVKTELQPGGIALIGYPDDEGIQANGGNKGAADGPYEIRHWLYRTTPHARRELKPISDLGDIRLKGSVEQRHVRAAKAVKEILDTNTQVLSLGGGNDYAYADGISFLEKYAGQQPLIINVDAHFDVRDLTYGLTSGTPFFRLLESDFKFEFVELGMQSQCNAAFHWNYVEEKGGHIISMEEILESGVSLCDYTVRRLGDSLLKRRPAFLAIDIDAFAWPYAIGSSAAWPVGITPHEFWPLLGLLLKRLDVRVMGIYEVAPKLDVSRGTAKLAAQIAHTFLHHV